MMPWLDVPMAGSQGVSYDSPYHEVPPQVWTDVQNIRFRDGEVLSFAGHDLGGENGSQSDIYSLSAISSPTQHYWVSIGASPGGMSVYSYDGTLFRDQSPSVALTGTRADIITPTELNGNLIFTNGADQPHRWPVDVGTLCSIIPGWDATWLCRAIAAHKGYLVALDMTEGGTRYLNRVRWSDEAAPGDLPQSWDELDPAVDAGLYEIDTDTEIQLGANLRDELMVYAQDSIHGMQLVGGTFNWRFRKISSQTGALSRRAVASFKGRHVVMTDQDIVLFDGQNPVSIIDKKNRRFYLGQLDSGNYGFAYAVAHRLRQEVWCCFPSAGQAYCDLALVWDWNNGTWGTRELPEGNLSAVDALDITGLQVRTWDGPSSVGVQWDSSIGPWDVRSFNALGGRLLLSGIETAAYSGAPIFRAEVGNTFDGVGKTSRAEKLGIRVTEDERTITVHEVWPRATGGAFNVRVGTQDVPNGPVTWRANKLFDPEQDRKVSLRVTGRYPCVAFESVGTDVSWRLHGYKIKYQPNSAR